MKWTNQGLLKPCYFISLLLCLLVTQQQQQQQHTFIRLVHTLTLIKLKKINK